MDTDCHVGYEEGLAIPCRLCMYELAPVRGRTFPKVATACTHTDSHLGYEAGIAVPHGVYEMTAARGRMPLENSLSAV